MLSFIIPSSIVGKLLSEKLELSDLVFYFHFYVGGIFSTLHLKSFFSRISIMV